MALRIYVLVLASASFSLVASNQVMVALVIGGIVLAVLLAEARRGSHRGFGSSLNAEPPAVVLGWSAGRWTLQSNGHYRVIQPSKRCIAFPWLLYFRYSIAETATPFRKSGEGAFWLFADSLTEHEQRQLRVRLRLDGMV